MKIGIIGGGAIGLLCGSALTKVGLDVTIITRSPSQCALLVENGVTLIKNSTTEYVNVNVTCIEECSFSYDLIIVAVKSYQLTSVVDRLKHVYSKRVLFIQNGMSHLQMQKVLPQHDVYYGIVEHGVKKISATAIDWNGNGRIVVGMNEEKSVFQWLSQKCGDFFSLLLVEDIMPVIRQKLLANLCINPLTALLNVNNGELVANPSYRQMMRMAFDEAIFVLEMQNISLQWEYVCGICEKTRDNISSMRSDVLNGHPTEIEAIVGYVLTLAEAHKKKVPVLQFLYNGVKGLEYSGGSYG